MRPPVRSRPSKTTTCPGARSAWRTSSAARSWHVRAVAQVVAQAPAMPTAPACHQPGSAHKCSKCQRPTFPPRAPACSGRSAAQQQAPQAAQLSTPHSAPTGIAHSPQDGCPEGDPCDEKSSQPPSPIHGVRGQSLRPRSAAQLVHTGQTPSARALTVVRRRPTCEAGSCMAHGRAATLAPQPPLRLLLTTARVYAGGGNTVCRGAAQTWAGIFQHPPLITSCPAGLYDRPVCPVCEMLAPQPNTSAG